MKEEIYAEHIVELSKPGVDSGVRTVAYLKQSIKINL